MNYYEHHIGDYAAATGHLSLVEDAIYSRLLRRYYLQEQALPVDVAQVARLCGARAPEEVAAVEVVLQEFFALGSDGWHNKRADEEIERYQSKQAKARASAEARWSKDAKPSDSERNAVALQAHCNGNALQTPDTSISTSLRSVESARKRAPSAPACPDDVDPQTWTDWLALRKAKKAPVTETVLRSAQGEARKAGMPLEQFLRIWCARGSQGLQADWLKPHERAGPQSAQPPQQSKTLSAIQRLQALKHGNLDSQRDSGRPEPVALLGSGPNPR
ncbi:YdaU family protein [Xanthomonas sp. SHU 199]|uniref:YdaU family protein n=1 Tax=Xanthomonas sp. SHU 199 TaxID=1591174 RepID=UPI0009D94BF5|nr:YdaU family protein [Xanthomonas sp. SHU 199]